MRLCDQASDLLDEKGIWGRLRPTFSGVSGADGCALGLNGDNDAAQASEHTAETILCLAETTLENLTPCA